MTIPDWWEATLLALAAWRVFQLIAHDDLFNPVWSRFPDKVRKGKIGDFISCPYCFGFWIAIAWWAAWQAWEHGTLVVASVFALSAGVIAASKILSSE
jgi:uncharacterized protein DUF1360